MPGHKNAKLYTVLVSVAVITSQFAGVRSEYVLRQEWPLLSTRLIGIEDRPTGDDTVFA